MLRVLNHELGADFDPSAFAHRAFYEAANHRIEMHLVSLRSQRVFIPGLGVIRLAAGESIRTEISAKHDRASVTQLFTAAGLRVESWRTDAEALFALVVGAAA
jgi:L-histidine N-alpha-methyltransferase